MNILKITLLIFLILPNTSYSKWLCMEVATVREGNVYKSCGVGEAKTESEARALARTNAIKEFQALCDLSASCQNREYNITPLRNSCEKNEDGFKCFRGIQFEINSKKKVSNKTDPAKLKALEEQLEVVQKEYEQKRKEHEVKQQIENLKKKIEEKKFEKEKPLPKHTYHKSSFSFSLNLFNKLPFKNVNSYFENGNSGVGFGFSYEENIKRKFYLEYTFYYNFFAGKYSENSYKEYTTKFENSTLGLRPKYFITSKLTIAAELNFSYNYFGDDLDSTIYYTNIEYNSWGVSYGINIQYFFSKIQTGSFYIGFSLLNNHLFSDIKLNVTEKIENQFNNVVNIGYVYGN